MLYSVVCLQLRAILFWKIYHKTKKLSNKSKVNIFKLLNKPNIYVKFRPNSKWCTLFQVFERAQSQIPHIRPETPQSLTHNHDEDFSDDDSDEKNLSSKSNGNEK